jgi:hypothetical protein
MKDPPRRRAAELAQATGTGRSRQCRSPSVLYSSAMHTTGTIIIA